MEWFSQILAGKSHFQLQNEIIEKLFLPGINSLIYTFYHSEWHLSRVLVFEIEVLMLDLLADHCNIQISEVQGELINGNYRN